MMCDDMENPSVTTIRLTGKGMRLGTMIEQVEEEMGE